MTNQIATENKSAFPMRSSNIELLRIVLILMVITLHYFNGHIGGFFAQKDVPFANELLAHFLESACIIAVNVFILITGYFSCNKFEISLSKPIKLYALMVFYGGILAGLAYGLHMRNFDFSLQTLKDLMSGIFYRWFVVYYCILYVLIPFLNKLVHALKQKELLQLLGINALLFYVISTFSPWPTMPDGGYGIINFVNLYLVGAYLRLYRPSPLSKFYSFAIYALCVILTMICSFTRFGGWTYSTIFNLIGAIAVFEFFRALSVKSNRAINQLASYTFDVYILNSNLFLELPLFRGLFHSDHYYHSPYILVNCMVTVVGIYLICVLIAFARRVLFTRIWDNQFDKIPYRISVEK